MSTTTTASARDLLLSFPGTTAGGLHATAPSVVHAQLGAPRASRPGSLIPLGVHTLHAVSGRGMSGGGRVYLGYRATPDRHLSQQPSPRDAEVPCPLTPHADCGVMTSGELPTGCSGTRLVDSISFRRAAPRTALLADRDATGTPRALSMGSHVLLHHSGYDKDSYGLQSTSVQKAGGQRLQGRRPAVFSVRASW